MSDYVVPRGGGLKNGGHPFIPHFTSIYNTIIMIIIYNTIIMIIRPLLSHHEPAIIMYLPEGKKAAWVA